MLSRSHQSGRKTGIDILGDVPWGTHLCLFCETEQDLIDILVPYFKAGLESNEFCMWVTSEPLNEKKAKDALRAAIPDFDRYLETVQIEIVPHDQWYLQNGKVNLDRVLNSWIDKLNQALSAGFAGMRVTGNTTWLEKVDWKNFCDYERQVNNVIGKYQLIAICTYSLDRCGATEVVDVVNSHRYALIRREGKWEVIENAEYKKAKNDLEKSEEKYRSLAENLNELVYRANPKTIVATYVNRAIEKIYGYTIDEWLKNPNLWVDTIHPDDAKRVLAEFTKAQKEVKNGVLEYRIIRQDKAVRWVQDRFNWEKDQQGKVISMNGLMYDITKRKKSEEALKVSENKYRTVLENLPQKVYLKDKNSVYISCNENYAADLKIKAAEITGKTDYDFFPKELAEKYRADDKRIMKSGKTEDINEKYIQNGRELVIHTVKTPVRDEQGNVAGILSIFWDITAQRQAQKRLLAYQKRLRDLASEMSLTEERERKRLAIELHDQVTQNLILFKINLGELCKKDLPAKLIIPLDEIYKHLDQIIGDMRSLTFDLGSPTLYELGLEAAVREYLHEEIQQKHEIKTEFEDDAQPKPLDEDVCALLYRAVRELLINVVKHAQAQCVKVSICKSNNKIRINVIDDGVGFKSPAEGFASGKTAGFGLFSIRERLSYLGGGVDIESKPGKGTQVTLAAPIVKCGKNVEKLI